MTLKDLCSYFRKYSDNEDKCEHYKNQYFVANHNNFHFEELDEQDIVGLRPYLQCFVLGIYECLAAQYRQTVGSWLIRYSDVYCKLEENDWYLGLKRTCRSMHGEEGDEIAAFIYDS